jgi:hypothetical protein
MSVKPRTLLQKIQWFESHVGPWNTNAVAIGTSVVEAAAFQAKTEAARAALTAADETREASKNASLALKNAVAAADVAASGVIMQIRAKAETTHNPEVYVLGSIPAPATPSGRGAPGEASNFKVELQNNGALTLTWKCANPAGTSGTSYMVWRRIGTEQLAFLGATGLKKFVDATIPAGTVTATYQIQAFRSTMAGPWAQFNVNFTTEIGGAMSAMVASQSAKIAA